MRDVKRCRILINWFGENLLTTQEREANKEARGKGSTVYKAKIDTTDNGTKAIVLALAHCYHSRLSTTKHRQEYRRIFICFFVIF